MSRYCEAMTLIKKTIKSISFTAHCVLLTAYCALMSAGCNPSSETYAVDSDTAHLPFPSFTVVQSDSSLAEGYFFIAPFKMPKESPKKFSGMMILAGDGSVAWANSSSNGSNFQIHDDGRMSYFEDSLFYFMDSTFTVIDSVGCANGAKNDAHELLVLPNGHYVLIGIRTEVENHSDMIVSGPKEWRGSVKTQVKYGIIQELDEKKNLVWSWHSKGHFNWDDYDPVYLADSNKLDMPHFNAIDVDSLGNFLLTARYTNEVVYLNRHTGEIDWRLGGKHSSFEMIGTNPTFLGQHAAQFMPGNRILLYDNGYSFAGNTHNARSAEYELDTVTKQARIIQSITWGTTVVSEATGNVQRLSHGATLITFGRILNLTPAPFFIVADSTGKTIFELQSRDTMASYRTYYYPTLPFAFQPLEIKVEYLNNGVRLSTGDDKEHLWSTGQQAESIVVTKAGLYQWFETDEKGNWRGSKAFEATGLNLTLTTE